MIPLFNPRRSHNLLDPNWASVTLLMQASAGVVDRSSSALTVTANNGAATSATQSKFGGVSYSMLNGGSNNGFFTFSASSGFTFGAGDYTFECWLYPTASGVDIFSTGITAITDRGYYLSIQKPQVARGSDGTLILVPTETVTTNAWSHIAFTRASNTFRAFINGTLCATSSTDSATLTANAPKVGASGSNLYEAAAAIYIDQVRITKGVARYTTTFSAPTQPFPVH